MKYSAGISFLILEREACVEDSPPERIGSRSATRNRANFAPPNKYEIEGEQNRLGLDGVAILGDGGDGLVRNGIDEKSSDNSSDPRGRRVKTNRSPWPEFPGLPPFAALKEKRSVVLKPPGARERQVEELGRILTDQALAVFFSNSLCSLAPRAADGIATACG
jgi:hypothetical protein